MIQNKCIPLSVEGIVGEIDDGCNEELSITGSPEKIS